MTRDPTYCLSTYLNSWPAQNNFSNLIWMIVGWALIHLISLLECFRSDQLVDYNGTFYNAFRCIQWTKITDNSYMYYPMTGKVKQNLTHWLIQQKITVIRQEIKIRCFSFVDEESLASNTRIKLELYDPTKVQWDTSGFCSPTIPPDTEQFYILVKKGSAFK